VQARFEPHHAVLAWAQLHPAALTVGTLVRDLLDSPAQRLDLRRARAEELDEVGPAVIHCHRKLFLGASGQTWGQLSDQILELMSGIAPEAGPTTLYLSLTEPTGHFWRALENLHGQISEGAPLMPFLVRAVLDTRRDTTAGNVAYSEV